VKVASSYRHAAIQTAVFVLVGLWLLANAPMLSAQAGLQAHALANQDQKQHETDRFQCHEWAVGQSGINPNRTTVQTGYDYKRPAAPDRDGYFGQAAVGEGGVVVDAAGGAVAGVAGGLIVGSGAAAAGVVAGTLFGVVRRFSWDQEQANYRQQLAARQATEKDLIIARTEHYRRAWATCMQSRKYEVRQPPPPGNQQ
jgi:hypothetical protein